MILRVILLWFFLITLSPGLAFAQAGDEAEPSKTTPAEAGPTEEAGPSPTFAPLEGEGEELPSRDVGFLRSDDLRYPETNIFLRILADIPAIPASVTTWGWGDWAIFAGVTGTVGTLMLPTDPPPDVRFNRWITPETDKFLPEIWAMEYQVPFWAALASGLFTTWGVAWLREDDELFESLSLAAEAVTVGQVYHLSLKLAFGRDGSGTLKSFPESLELFPQGTPSGHFTTLYAIYGSLEAYWDPHWAVRVGMHTLLASMWITHMLNHKHYLSEQLFGAALGYSVSYWVVRHRSSRHRYEEDGTPLRIGVMPVQGGGGLTLGGSW